MDFLYLACSITLVFPFAYGLTAVRFVEQKDSTERFFRRCAYSALALSLAGSMIGGLAATPFMMLFALVYDVPVPTVAWVIVMFVYLVSSFMTMVVWLFRDKSWSL